MKPLEDVRLAGLAWLACFGSIAAMLGHVSAIAPFWTLGWSVLLPCTGVLIGVYVRALRSDMPELARSLRVGFWGGVWGTLGYDLVRIPLHYAGLNPFAPIRSYGMFLANAPSASLGTDWLGALYHLSNGVGFGIAYALLMRGRSLWWGVLWGLVLEVLAVITPYGEVYQIRYAPTVLAIGFFAHVYYGLPLGGAVQEPEAADRWVSGPGSWRVKLGTALALAALLGFLGLAWEAPGPALEPGRIEVGTAGFRSGWTRVKVGQTLVLEGRGAEEQRVEFPGLGRTVTVPAGGTVELQIDRPGLFQLVGVDRPWRSAFVSVEKGPYPR